MTAATEAGQRADTAEAAQATAEGERDAANMRELATQAMADETLAMTAATEAGQRAGTAEAAQATAEGACGERPGQYAERPMQMRQRH